MVHMGGESWRAIKDLKAPFSDLKAGHVDHLLTCVYFSNLGLLLLYCCLFFYCTAVFFGFFSTYICSKLLKLRFLTHSTLHSLILLNSEAKIFNTLFYSLIFLSC